MSDDSTAQHSTARQTSAPSLLKVPTLLCLLGMFLSFLIDVQTGWIGLGWVVARRLI